MIDFDEYCYMALPLNVYEDESHKSHDSAQKSDTLLCAAVGTASYQHGLEVYTVCGISGTATKWQSCTKTICTKLAS